MLLTGLIVVAVLLFAAGAYSFLRERFAWGRGFWTAGLLVMALAGWLVWLLTQAYEAMRLYACERRQAASRLSDARLWR
jgi:hypothetical protein